MDDEGEDDDCLKFYSEEINFDGDQNTGEVSLREWLDQPKRQVDLVECLHIFQQVVETVNLAHSQRVVVNNIRPSCFVISTFNCISFIESASCSSSASGTSSGEEDVRRDGAVSDQQAETTTYLSSTTDLSLTEELQGKRELDVAIDVWERRDFPLKKILSMEFTWYRSPEEAEGGKSTFASDIYKLGVLLFELFCTFDTSPEKAGIMSNLRYRLLPPQMLFKWPKEASFCLRLLHPQPSSRPAISELLQSEFLNERKGSLGEREAAIKLTEGIEEQELLLDFLQLLQRRKLEASDNLHDTIGLLSADIEEVDNQMSIMMKNGCSFLGLEKDHETVHKIECPMLHYEMNEESSSSVSRKRIRLGPLDCADENKEMRFDGPTSESKHDIQEKVRSKSSRIMKNFQNLEVSYFSSRCMPIKSTGKFTSRKLLPSNLSSGSTIKTEGSSVDYLAPMEGNCGRRMGEWVNPFFEDLCKYLSFSKFKVNAELKQRELLNSSCLICSLAFDRDKEFFATAGLNRKIKVFEFDAIINQEPDVHYPVIEMASKSKLSNICWNGYIKHQIASSDFEGVVQVWDVTSCKVFLEMREHEKRVWSVNYSLVDPTKLASGGDDGTVKLWKINQGRSTGTIRTKANVCSVEFPPDSSGTLAIGSADHNVYYYDLRNISLPLRTFVGHAKTVSYVKFLDSSTLVSSSTDNSLKLWDLSVSTSRVVNNPIQTFTGHTNVKNFVGLSSSNGYIATGSETNEVFVYQKAFPMPVLSYKFGNIDLMSGFEADDANQFISCVCWRGQSTDLIATNSNGNIKILEMV